MARRAGDELRIRARQQAAVAALGQRALARGDLETLLDDAAQTRLVVPADSPLLRVLELTDVAGVAAMHRTLAEALAGE